MTKLWGDDTVRNFDWCVYTYKHRIAFKYVVEKLIPEGELREELLRRARVHDMDKMVMYLFMDQLESQMIHVQKQPHHLESDLEKSYEDLVETVIDYECAPYTKPDKPLNAYDFVKKLREMGLLEEKLAEKLISIMKEFGIDRSGTTEEDRQGLEFIVSIGTVTEEMILMEVLDYIDENRDNNLEFIRKQIGR